MYSNVANYIMTQHEFVLQISCSVRHQKNNLKKIIKKITNTYFFACL